MDIFTQADSLTQLITQFTTCPQDMLQQTVGHRTVSYTHLDVYKRQSIHCSWPYHLNIFFYLLIFFYSMVSSMSILIPMPFLISEFLVLSTLINWQHQRNKYTISKVCTFDASVSIIMYNSAPYITILSTTVL